MSDSLDEPDKQLISQFIQVLDECRGVYQRAGSECELNHPELVARYSTNFSELMHDLHIGLVIKIFVSMARIDRRWSRSEQRLGKELFSHIWGKNLSDEDNREALKRIVIQSDRLKWSSLVRPFEKLPPLRAFIGELESVVIRMSNLVAKIDGNVGDQEMRQITWIQDEVFRYLKPIPLEEEESNGSSDEAAHAVRQLRDDGKHPPKPPEDSTAQPTEKSAEEKLAEALGELEKLIGLDSIKNEIQELVNFLKIQKEREKLGLPASCISFHLVFMGNPGTGKTTVARIIGRIFGALSLLKKGHVIETDRSGLVAEYVGQTATKTMKKIDSALDGVLFIDEAYTLISETGEDAYGAEAVQILLKRMEDDRDRLVVILAGYPEPIERLLHSNPGLSSRFTHKLEFSDYKASELAEIFERMCAQSNYELGAGARARLLRGFQFLINRSDEHFGNGRLARNVFENAIRELANRIVSIAPLTRELLTTLEASDILMEGIPLMLWGEWEREKCQYNITCPNCGNSRDLPSSFLGRRVRCKKCGERFQASWGEPVLTK